MKRLLSGCSSKELLYETIIEMGRELPPFPSTAKIEENRVLGCQSILYLEGIIHDQRVYFNADSEALISKGLAAILIAVYSEEPPEAVIQIPPQFLTEVGLPHLISPARFQGTASLYQQMVYRAAKGISDRDTE